MKILGIETSCDETAASLLQISNSKYQVTNKSKIQNPKLEILSNVIASQVEIHKKYGGIVPEVAARQHVQAIIPVIQEALASSFKFQVSSFKEIQNSKNQLSKPDLIAVTVGPGLITSLQVGVQTAKTLAYVWGVPLVGINHLEAHLWSFLLNHESQVFCLKQQTTSAKGRSASGGNNKQQFPSIGLIISGGHTEMVLVKGIGKYELIGRTRDDAVGEAFDKVAKLLNIGYPGGPIIGRLAKKGDPNKIKFPRPMIDSKDFDFSLSGLKTAVKYHVQNLSKTDQQNQSVINDICAGFQQAVIDVLIAKTIKAAKQFKAKSIILGGGVSANEQLISNLKQQTLFRAQSRETNNKIDFYYPEKQFTGDNAAMVALAGFFKQAKASKLNWKKLTVEPNLKII